MSSSMRESDVMRALGCRLGRCPLLYLPGTQYPIFRFRVPRNVLARYALDEKCAFSPYFDYGAVIAYKGHAGEFF